MEITIKPCPHCGGSSCLYANYSHRYRQYFVCVKCEICGSQGKTFSDPNDPEQSGWNDAACNSAISAWNMRKSKGDRDNDL